jgi:hypothetical protein
LLGIWIPVQDTVQLSTILPTCKLNIISGCEDTICGGVHGHFLAKTIQPELRAGYRSETRCREYRRWYPIDAIFDDSKIIIGLAKINPFVAILRRDNLDGKNK